MRPPLQKHNPRTRFVHGSPTAHSHGADAMRDVARRRTKLFAFHRVVTAQFIGLWFAPLRITADETKSSRMRERMANPMTTVFREPDGVLPNTLAIAYAFGGFVLALLLITSSNVGLCVIGTLMLTAALSVAAYLIHDCAHGTLFRLPKHNEAVGHALAWLVGACYGKFDDLRWKHLSHHADRIDCVSYDYRATLQRHPGLRRVVERLEWCFIPAVDLLMHATVIAAPFTIERLRDRRNYVLMVIAVRLAFFAGLFWLSPVALLCYAVGYLLFLHLLRFMDAYQHTYELVVIGDRTDLAAVARPSREFEEQHTYNAHHQRPGVPWYRLPQAHREIYGSDETNTLPFMALLRNYVRNRVHIVLGEYGVTEQRITRADTFPGALGVSFLTQF